MASSTASSPGNSRLNNAHREALAAIVESGPVPAIYSVVRWRIVDLCQWLFEEFRVVVSKQTLSRELRALGYRKLSTGPKHHAPTEGAIEEYKKILSASERIRAGKEGIGSQYRNLVL